MNVRERFLDYVRFDTQSDSGSDSFPSTAKQLLLGKYLADELRGLGIEDAECDSLGYVYAHIPASGDCTAPNLALIAHMDTAMEMSGANVKARVICDYDGGDIVLDRDKQIITRGAEFPGLALLKGQDLIVTDGNTLLGADNKAGIAEIMTLSEYLMKHKDFPHSGISILFTPDEEIGRSADHVNLSRLDAAWGYTVDGGRIGELSYENFNAASASITVHGVAAHPGYAKGIMKNAASIAMEFHGLLPASQTPACTDGKDGYFHLDRMEGNVLAAKSSYFIRDFDRERLVERQALLREVTDHLNRKYGEGTICVEITETYCNMLEKIKECPALIDRALQAMEMTGITPVISPVRGGTDGARLSYLGLPCPNLCTGGENGHSRHELVSIQSMERVVEFLKQLVSLFA